ncbi:hypothetical protein DEF23_02490 [Marinitenerispora sediminis]|uniref:Uncharacterized protein n=1 Tax=Marinitenerispora sediminis TaxID=1931232 RepID=A0A368T5F3_9ACTN|nr:hypothetical protein DEF28_08120 [Marinitenerispora sediminis]RCV58724.1 hypothetical protein DEF24_12380 [Marinitenerispora sediminis]RCV61372.1 hypothetical protein DEF23_02490 [Marinitenerispora sediminis]
MLADDGARGGWQAALAWLTSGTGSPARVRIARPGLAGRSGVTRPVHAVREPPRSRAGPRRPPLPRGPARVTGTPDRRAV